MHFNKSTFFLLLLSASAAMCASDYSTNDTESWLAKLTLPAMFLQPEDYADFKRLSPLPDIFPGLPTPTYDLSALAHPPIFGAAEVLRRISSKHERTTTVAPDDSPSTLRTLALSDETKTKRLCAGTSHDLDNRQLRDTSVIRLFSEPTEPAPTYAPIPYMSHAKSSHDVTSYESFIIEHNNLICDARGCNLIFENRKDLHDHIKNRHVKNNFFECNYPTCEKNYRTSHIAHFKSHLLFHSDRRPFECTKCQRSFRKRYQIIKHFTENRCVLSNTIDHAQVQ